MSLTGKQKSGRAGRAREWASAFSLFAVALGAISAFRGTSYGPAVVAALVAIVEALLAVSYAIEDRP